MTEQDTLAPLFFDLVGPFTGPCELCGGPDQRHRVWDSILEQILVGASLSGVVAEFGVSLDGLRAWFFYPETIGHTVRVTTPEGGDLCVTGPVDRAESWTNGETIACAMNRQRWSLG